MYSSATAVTILQYILILCCDKLYPFTTYPNMAPEYWTTYATTRRQIYFTTKSALDCQKYKYCMSTILDLNLLKSYMCAL